MTTRSEPLTSSTFRRNLKLGVGAYATFQVLSCVYGYYAAKKEIAFRKEQLAKPIYELKGDEAVNLPWTRENVRDWLYRRVRITGRPIHVNACLVPRRVYELHGFEYVVPLITRENTATGVEEGVVFSKGFLPKELKNPGDRVRIEDVSWQTFEGFVSTLDELSGHGFLEGNSTDQGRLSFTHSNMRDFADATGFKNKDKAAVAMIEMLGPGGSLDERDPIRYAHEAEYKIEYPYPKTIAGALQLEKMPWNYKNEGLIWTGVAATAFASLVL